VELRGWTVEEIRGIVGTQTLYFKHRNSRLGEF